MAQYLYNQTIEYPAVPRLSSAPVIEIVMMIAGGGALASYGSFFTIANAVQYLFVDFTFGSQQLSIGTGTPGAGGGYAIRNVFQSPGVWIHWRHTIDLLDGGTSQQKMYRDGELITGSDGAWTSPSPTPFGENPIVLGGATAARFAKVGIYDHRLTDGEMNSLVRGAFPYEVAPDALAWTSNIERGRPTFDMVSGQPSIAGGGSEVDGPPTGEGMFPDLQSGLMRPSPPWLHHAVKVR